MVRGAEPAGGEVMDFSTPPRCRSASLEMTFLSGHSERGEAESRNPFHNAKCKM